jgi:TonB family protein
MGYGEYATISIKQGNYFRQSGMITEYQDPKLQKSFIKVQGIDTLFYVDYASDSTEIENVKKTDDVKKIAGFDCKSIIIKSSKVTRQYYYAPSLYLNPEYDKNNKLGRFDEYAKQTSSIYLANTHEYESFNFSMNATNVEQKRIDDLIFQKPDLPLVPYDVKYFIKSPEFARSMGWVKYLNANLNADLGAKYIKIPKGEKEASITVIVQFIVNRNGSLEDIKVVNKKEVHPKLAEEAVRVIRESGQWKPATWFGEKINQAMKQPITFVVTKE